MPFPAVNASLANIRRLEAGKNHADRDNGENQEPPVAGEKAATAHQELRRPGQLDVQPSENFHELRPILKIHYYSSGSETHHVK